MTTDLEISSNGNTSDGNALEYSVTDLSNALKRTVEDRFGYVRVRAELSGVKIPGSGHMYLSLKDDKSVLNGVMWRGNVSRLTFRPEDGLEVVCTGKLTTYGARSQYQMVVDSMAPAGAGALMALLEERKKKLASEGLFAADVKKPIPFLPRHIAVVTSPTGAVIRDILHRLADRFPSRVTLWPVRVQGEGAADEIAAAIHGFNNLGPDWPKPDLLIVARGGGSVEDLWSFNEEAVVRAVAASHIPVISAVGHETDTTLIDYAADRRAPTPTGAAEMAVPVRQELLATVGDLGRRLDQMGLRLVSDRREAVSALARALPKPRDLLGVSAQKLDDLGERLPRALMALTSLKARGLDRVAGGLSLGPMRTRLARDRQQIAALGARLKPAAQRLLDKQSDRLDAQSRLLETLSHKSVLSRGYAIVRTQDDGVVKTAAAAMAAGNMRLTFADGDVAVTTGSMPMSSSVPPSAQASKPKPAKSKPQSDDKQGSLL